MKGLKLFITVFIILITFHSSRAQDRSSVPGNDTVIITGVGDIMLGTSFPDKKYLPPGNDPFPLMSSVFNILQDSDIVFANLEGPFSDDAKLVKKCRDTTKCYAFRVPENYSAVLDSAGFNTISLANNHMGDFGEQARESTTTIFDSLGINYAGLDTCPYSIFSIDSVLYGFCAFAPNKGTVNLHNEKEAADIVSFLNDSCDIVIVSIHGGAEGKDYQNVTREEEFYFGENRGNIYEFAHKMIDYGADIVFGHGPHVTRAIELYKKRFIAYSLGNFCTYRRFNLSGPNGYAPVLRISTNRNGEFLEGRIIPVYQNNSGHVKQDSQKRAIFKIRELLVEDFPDTLLSISDDGLIQIK